MRIALFGVLLALATGTQAASPGTVVFSELMWMGSTVSSSDEWIELHNTGGASVDLNGWTIARMSGEEIETMIVIPEGKISAGGVFLISNFGADDERSRLQAEPQLVDAAVSLPNSRLQLFLYDGDPSLGSTVIDIADDGTGSPMGGDNDLKRSMVRVMLDGDGTSAKSWTTADEAAGWDPDSSELGTPGTAPAFAGTGGTTTPESATQVQATAWATVKDGVYTR